MSIPPLSDILVACDEVGWAWGKRSPGASEDMLFGISRGLATLRGSYGIQKYTGMRKATL